MNLTPEQAVYSAAFTQALATVCGLGRTRGDEITYQHPTAENIWQADAWAYLAVEAWRTVNKENR